MRIELRDSSRRRVGRVTVDPTLRPTRVSVESAAGTCDSAAARNATTAGAPALAAAPREAFLDWESALDDAGQLRRCVACGCGDMFREKAFPQLTAFVVLLAFAGAIVSALGLATELPVLILMGLVLVLDVAILFFSRRRLVCYRCRSSYHDLPMAHYHRRWDRTRRPPPSASARSGRRRARIGQRRAAGGIRKRTDQRQSRGRRTRRRRERVFRIMMAMSQTLILFGGGGHAAVVAEIAKAAGFVVVGYLDDAEPPAAPPDAPAPAPGRVEVMGFKRLGALADLPSMMALHRHAAYHAAVGDGPLREKWLASASPRPTPAIISADAIVSPSASIGDGVFIGPRAVINARATIGKGCIINTGAIVEHDCTIEPFAHLAPGSVLAGNVTVGAFTLIGAGAVVIPGVKIGANAVVGAGAVVLSDLADGVTAVGVPAKAG